MIQPAIHLRQTRNIKLGWKRAKLSQVQGSEKSSWLIDLNLIIIFYHNFTFLGAYCLPSLLLRQTYQTEWVGSEISYGTSQVYGFAIFEIYKIINLFLQSEGWVVFFKMSVLTMTGRLPSIVLKLQLLRTFVGEIISPTKC